ncbi:MAG: hypothetical protein IJJ26_07295 [Victivallales bacterium]|nr:hypothetical protein [Victivallales bacterium]
MMKHLPGSYIAVDGLRNAGSVNKKEPLATLFGICNGAMQMWSRVFLYFDRPIRTNPHWIRDYMLTVKGFKYTERDLRSFPDLLLEHQHETGFFYEILAPIQDMHSGVPLCGTHNCHIVEEPYRKYEEGCQFGLCRLQLEADIEYLMVEGCYQIWQATGDDEWLLAQLPRLEKGLHYTQSDPCRWDETYQLVKRPHTLDTWDFTDRPSSSFDRMIRPEDPMGIFHGDNTGLYYAHTLLEKIYHYFQEEEKAERHHREAVALRERIMKHLWNGKFFRHFLMLDAADYGVDETWQLSLSNAYALNRDILTLPEKLSILEAYRACREKYHGELDDFRNLEPPFPVFKGIQAGAYVNGGNAPFVAGQLAIAAFECGMEEYGADIINRIGCKFLRDGKVSFLYNWNEEDIGGGPRCWSGAEIMSAMTRGLAGIVDESKLFQDVTISPRFAAAGEDHAVVRLEYPASGAFCEYEWRSTDQQKKVCFTLASQHRNCRLRLYAPAGMLPKQAWKNGNDCPFAVETVGQSHYACVENLQADDQICVVFA